MIGLDNSVLVLLGLTLPWRQALIAWGVAIATAELTNKRLCDTRLIHAGVCVLAGAAGPRGAALGPED